MSNRAASRDPPGPSRRAWSLAGALLLAVVSTLGACTAIPLATLAKFSQFDERQFASLDPAALRVRVSLPAGYAIDMKGVALTARVRSGDAARSGSFALQKVAEYRDDRGGGFASAPRPVITTTARLTQASIPRFRELQAFVGSHPADAIDLNVSLALSDAPKGATSTPVWVEVLLSREQGYVALIDGGTIALDKTQTYGKDQNATR